MPRLSAHRSTARRSTARRSTARRSTARRSTARVASILLRAVLFPGLILSLTACQQPEPFQPQEPAVTVTTEVLTRAPHRATLTLLGSVQPAATVAVVSPASGIVSYPRRFRAGLRTGEAVRDGEILAVVENQDLQLRLTEAELEARSATAELERMQRSFDEGLVAEAELERAQLQAELAGKRLDDARQRARRLDVRASASGHLIVQRLLPPGSEILAGGVLAEIASQGAPRVEGWAAAAERDNLKPGLTVRFAPPGGTTYGGEGTIREVAPVVDAGGTVRVVMEVLDVTNLPAPGEGVQVKVEMSERRNVLTLPEQAVLVDEGNASVYVLQSTGGGYRAERRGVELGGRGEGRIEILSGVVAGDRVAVDGVSFLSDGALARSADSDPGRSSEQGDNSENGDSENGTDGSEANEGQP